MSPSARSCVLITAPPRCCCSTLVSPTWTLHKTDHVNDSSSTRPRWLPLFIIVAALSAAGGYFLTRSGGSTPAPDASTPAPSATPDVTTFAPWVSHEHLPDSTRATWSAYYIDAVLGHQVFRIPPQGVPPQLARSLLLDDDGLL